MTGKRDYLKYKYIRRICDGSPAVAIRDSQCRLFAYTTLWPSIIAVPSIELRYRIKSEEADEAVRGFQS